MKNPGLDAFARAYVHPGLEDIRDPEDPDYQDPDDEDAWGEFTKGHSFGRWREPGSSIRVPTKVGPAFKPGESPEDVIRGEIISPAEQDSADRIIHGEHESDQPSANPYVAQAQHDLRTPGSSVAVETLSGLLKGGSPHDVGDMDEAHDYLSRHFTGVRVNPHHGTLMAASPAGMQLVRRQMNLPAIPEQPAEPTYKLTNKHGEFESNDPHRIIRSMIAFQIVHNEIAQERKKDDDDNDQDNGLTSTSAVPDWLRSKSPSGGGDISWKDALLGRTKRPDIPRPPKTPAPGAIFEVGAGTDKNEHGQLGGWVAPIAHAPADWYHDREKGVSFSRGHERGATMDPEQARTPRQDPDFPDHMFTYAPTPDYNVERFGGGARYYVQPTHPAHYNNLDVPRAPKVVPPSSRMPRRGPVAPRHEPPRSLPPTTSAAQANDLCPVCASGYLEPYDKDFHECLNCGSLVKHVGFEREGAARPKGGLGRGLKDIIPYTDDPLNLGTGGSENPDNVVDLDETQTHHPLAGEELDPEAEPTYVAPKRILGAAADPIDEFMGKQGFFPNHSKDGRSYLHNIPGVDGGYFRLTENVPKLGWALTADHIQSPEQWEHQGVPVRSRGVNMPVDSTDPESRYRREMLPDVGERRLGEKSILASGDHPIDNDSLNRAIRDVHTNGLNSQTYGKMIQQHTYKPPPVHTQSLSSVENPGLARFASVS